MEIFTDHNMAAAPSGDQVQGYLFGVDSSGNDLPGFPLRPEGFTYMNGATIGDVDGDGDYELGVLSYYETSAYVNLYDLTGTWHPGDVAWETYHKIGRRGGLSGSEDRLNFQGYFGLQDTVHIYLHDEPGRTAFLWAALGASKFHSLLYGWFYLDPNPILFTVIANFPFPPSGEIDLPVLVPNDPGLVGAAIYLQGAIYDPVEKKAGLTNMLGRTIQP